MAKLILKFLNKYDLFQSIFMNKQNFIQFSLYWFAKVYTLSSTEK